MFERWMNATTEEQKILTSLQLFFLLFTAFGFFYFAVEHWVIDHFLDSFQSQIPFYTSLIGFPLTLAMFFTTNKALRWPFTIFMVVTIGVGLAGAFFHLAYNASDAGVSLLSIGGIFEAFTDPLRPVPAALAHVIVGAVGLVVGLTIGETRPRNATSDADPLIPKAPPPDP